MAVASIIIQAGDSITLADMRRWSHECRDKWFFVCLPAGRLHEVEALPGYFHRSRYIGIEPISDAEVGACERVRFVIIRGQRVRSANYPD